MKNEKMHIDVEFVLTPIIAWGGVHTLFMLFVFI